MSSWHEKMADAVNQRKKALNGINRWQEKLAAAEQVIEHLSAERQTPETLSTAPATTAAQDAVLLTPDFNSVFGPGASA